MNERSTDFNKFTRRAKTALVVAQNEAQRRGQFFIEPEHLLLGFLCEPQSTASWVLSELGVVPGMVRATIETALLASTNGQESVNEVLSVSPGEQAAIGAADTLIPPGDGTTVKPQLSPRLKRVIEFAVAELVGLRQQELATGHFLLGMLREEQGRAFFHAWGIDLKAARAKMKRIRPQVLAAEQQPLPASALSSSSNEAILSDQARPIDAVQIDVTRQQRIIAQSRAIQKVRWIYYLVFAVIATIVIVFVRQSPHILPAYRAIAATLALTPDLDWQPVAGCQPLLVLLYYLVINSVLLAVVLPLAWYISLVIPRRHGFSKKTTRQWLQALKPMLPVYFEIYVLIEIASLLKVIQPQTWWAWTALVPTLFFIVMGYFGSSRSLFQAKYITPLSEGELSVRFQALKEHLNIPTCNLYQLKVSQRSKAANAFFAGWGRGRRVILTDTMVQQFPPEEVEVIMAHELGHFVHHDIWMRFVTGGLIFMSIGYLLNLYFTIFTTLADTSSLFALLQPLYFLLGVLLFLVLLRLNSLYHRYQEYRADEFALRAVNNVQTFKDAMTRLTNMNMPRRRTRRSGTHPTLVKRLRHADEFALRQDAASAPVHV